MPDSSEAIVAALEQIYKEIPVMNCRGKCQAYCSVIGFYPAEIVNVGRSGFALPMVTNADPRIAFCTALDQTSGSCTMYDARPIICRLWGVTKQMRCPHGCRPKRWLSDAQSKALMKRAGDLLAGAMHHNHPAGAHLKTLLNELAEAGIVPEGGWK